MFLTYLAIYIVAFVLLVAGLVDLRDKVNANPLYRFLAILSLGVMSSFIPYGILSAVLGFPAVFIASVLVSLLITPRR